MRRPSESVRAQPSENSGDERPARRTNCVAGARLLRVALALAIGSGLDAVATQARHAPAACCRFGAIEEHSAALFRRTHLQPIQRSIARAVIELGCERGQSRKRIAADGP